ncbi:unnamed protein product [Rodentolepis nana]|uniref:EF-hand domain-containing protein n=1 Tax=Rodentolepis nana TaxID=102285 RepID=A0A0R3TJ40_RODNA|nr:unnamed protein product [Rodentolepis nana]
MRRKMKQKKHQLQEIQDAIYAVDIDENDMTINDLRAEMNGEVDSETLATIFRSADTNNDKKLSKDERRALRVTLENKKVLTVS